MKRVFALTLLAVVVAFLCVASPTKTKSSAAASSRAHPTSASVTHTAKSGSAASKRVSVRVIADTKTSSRTANGRSLHSRSAKIRRAAYVAPAPSYQLHPDPERYQQIQRALADKGYFKGDPNGEWGDDSVSAMERFQLDQKLPNDGSISALSLIALGLGPKHDGNTAVAVPPGHTPAFPAAPSPTPTAGRIPISTAAGTPALQPPTAKLP